MDKIVIVGGGSSGWMTAATLIKFFPEKNITLVESPNIPTVGVGESTLGFINNWLSWIGIHKDDFMPHCDANYKLSIRFENFYTKDSGTFHYPFGETCTEGSVSGLNDWHFKRICYPDYTPIHDYSDCFYPSMALVNNNKIITNENNGLKGFSFRRDVAYQFDATKFGLWLRDYFCIPKGVNHVLSEVKDVIGNDDGIQSLVLDDGSELSGDFFIDCTGFKSLLLGDKLKEPFVSFEDILPNNSAWATKIPYKDKESEMVLYTNCCAINNGWVWDIPLWSRIGSGYVYSDHFISDDNALDEFKDYLRLKGHNPSDLEYKNIKMRIGIHERLWVKNVCAIGLSGGFIEPLESGGLFTTHEFLLVLMRTLHRGNVSEWDRNAFNFICRDKFQEFSEFVAMHYSLSHRNDTEYWNSNFNRDYSKRLSNNSILPSIDGFKSHCYQKFRGCQFREIGSGMHCIATGMHWFPTDEYVLNYENCVESYNILERYSKSFLLMDKRKDEWNNVALSGVSPYRFLSDKYGIT